MNEDSIPSARVVTQAVAGVAATSIGVVPVAKRLAVRRVRALISRSVPCRQPQLSMIHSLWSATAIPPPAVFFESALALLDVLDAELEQAVGISQRWYDVLVHLEDSPHGIPMNELAERILYSKSGFTRVVDRMEEAKLVRRARPGNDRRTILIVLTDNGTKMLERARRHHRDGIERHFSQHLTNAEIEALTHALEKISTHARPLRPGPIRG